VTYTTTTTTRVSTFYFRPRPLNTPEGFELKSAESLPIIVETTTPLSQIPSGQQTTFIPESQTQIQISSGPLSVSCTARIIQPSGVIESNTANNTLTGTVGR